MPSIVFSLQFGTDQALTLDVGSTAALLYPDAPTTHLDLAATFGLAFSLSVGGRQLQPQEWMDSEFWKAFQTRMDEVAPQLSLQGPAQEGVQGSYATLAFNTSTDVELPRSMLLPFTHDSYNELLTLYVNLEIDTSAPRSIGDVQSWLGELARSRVADELVAQLGGAMRLEYPRCFNAKWKGHLNEDAKYHSSIVSSLFSILGSSTSSSTRAKFESLFPAHLETGVEKKSFLQSSIEQRAQHVSLAAKCIGDKLILSGAVPAGGRKKKGKKAKKVQPAAPVPMVWAGSQLSQLEGTSDSTGNVTEDLNAWTEEDWASGSAQGEDSEEDEGDTSFEDVLMMFEESATTTTTHPDLAKHQEMEKDVWSMEDREDLLQMFD